MIIKSAWLIVALVHAPEFRYSDLPDLLETADPNLWNSVTKVMFEFDNNFSWSAWKYVELTWTRTEDVKHQTQHGLPSMGAEVDDNVVIFHDPQRKIGSITKTSRNKRLDTGKDVKASNGKGETMTI